MDFSKLLYQPTDTDDFVFSAQIEDLNADGTVNLAFRGGVVYSVPVLGWYTPESGAIVQIARRSPGQYLVLGATRTANPGSVKVSTSLSFPFTIDAVPSAPDTTDNPSGLASPFIVTANSTGSYRTADKWNGQGSQVRQGAYTTAYGYYTGCWFYGTKPQAAKDVTVTRLRITIRREQGGSFAAEPLYVYPHVHTSRPSGAPQLRTTTTYEKRAPVKISGVAVGNTATFDLPKEWGQALVDGYIKGFAVRQNSTSAYAVLSSKSEYSDSGKLTINWT